MEEIILDMVADPDFKDYMVRKIDEKVDVSSLEAEREQVREQLRQVMGAKKKLTEMLDRLDVNDKHYDRKYQDMHDRLDILYDRISELEEMIADIEAKISGAYGEKITADQLYKVLLNFDKMYYKMTDLEKERFMRDFIEEIELYPEKQDDGRILKQLSLGFPVFYEGSEGDTIRLHKENTVETIVLLQKSNRKCASNESKSELAPDLGECRDTARSLQSFGWKPDTYVKLSLDMEDYYRIMDAEGDAKIE